MQNPRQRDTAQVSIRLPRELVRRLDALVKKKSTDRRAELLRAISEYVVAEESKLEARRPPSP